MLMCLRMLIHTLQKRFSLYIFYFIVPKNRSALVDGFPANTTNTRLHILCVLSMSQTIQRHRSQKYTKTGLDGPFEIVLNLV